MFLSFCIRSNICSNCRCDLFNSRISCICDSLCWLRFLQKLAACFKIDTFGALSNALTCGTNRRRSSKASRSSTRLIRSMLLCWLLFSVSNSSSEEFRDWTFVFSLFWQFRLLRFVGVWFSVCWAFLFRFGFSGGLPRGRGAGLSLNAVFMVSWKRCCSAGLKDVGKVTGLMGFSNETTSISSSSSVTKSVKQSVRYRNVHTNNLYCVLKILGVTNKIVFKLNYSSSNMSYLFSSLNCSNISTILLMLYYSRVMNTHKRFRSSYRDIFIRKWVTRSINNKIIAKCTINHGDRLY